MAKWYGKVGYAELVESVPGVWKEAITERSYYGESFRNTRSLQNSGEVIDNVNVGNQISIVADPFAYQNFHKIRYIEFMGSKWKVTNIDVQYPRLIFTIGGVWNGEQT